MARPNLPPLESSLERLWDAIYNPIPDCISPPLLFDTQALSRLVSGRDGDMDAEVSEYLASMQRVSQIKTGFKASKRRIELVGCTALDQGKMPSLIVELARSPTTNRIDRCDVSMTPHPLLTGAGWLYVSRISLPLLEAYMSDCLAKGPVAESRIAEVGELVSAVGDVVLNASGLVPPAGGK